MAPAPAVTATARRCPSPPPACSRTRGCPRATTLEAEVSTETIGGTQLLASRSSQSRRTISGAQTAQAAAASVPLEARPLEQVGVNATAADETVRLRGDRSSDDRLLADTRESLIAGYLDGWKRRVERVGTLNFPNEARRRGMSGNPVLEVAISADGSLDQVVVRRSSGHRELDNAALGIVRLASPFDPFPPAMRERYPVLRFAYEWQFLDGRLGGRCGHGQCALSHGTDRHAQAPMASTGRLSGSTPAGYLRAWRRRS